MSVFSPHPLTSPVERSFKGICIILTVYIECIYSTYTTAIDQCLQSFI